MRWSPPSRSSTIPVVLPRVPAIAVSALGALLLLAGFGSVTPLSAGTIYTNFGTGDAYANGAGLLVTNDGQAYSSVALGFTPAANYYLNSIEFVATDLIPNDSAAISVSIFADNGSGQPGGSPLESFSVAGLGSFGATVPVLSVTSSAQPLLYAGSEYWIGLNAAPGDMIVWNQNSTGATSYSQTDGSGNWSSSGSYQGVVEIDGTLAPAGLLSSNADSPGSAPEPASCWLIAAGALAMFYLSRPSLAQAKQRARFPYQK